ncbi:three-helix bundle dimerization domain-containing protein [Nocardia xishanensis]
MTETPVPADRPAEPSVDQQHALRTAAARLAKEFDGVPENAIDQFLHAAYDHMADDAAFDNFLPLLAERYTREWLRALAEAETSA